MGYSKIKIKVDPGNALIALLEKVAEPFRKRNIETEVVRTAVNSHQSIGAVELAHRSIGGHVRTFIKQLETTCEMLIEPDSMLFPWVIRHAVWLLLRYHVRSDGNTAYHIITGKDARHQLCKFWETVFFFNTVHDRSW